MTMLIEELRAVCKQRDFCCGCPMFDECEEKQEDIYNMPFGFVLEIFQKQHRHRNLRARLVFERPVAMPLKIGGIMKLKDPGVYLVYAPDRDLEQVNKDIEELKKELKRLEHKKEMLTFD